MARTSRVRLWASCLHKKKKRNGKDEEEENEVFERARRRAATEPQQQQSEGKKAYWKILRRGSQAEWKARTKVGVQFRGVCVISWKNQPQMVLFRPENCEKVQRRFRTTEIYWKWQVFLWNWSVKRNFLGLGSLRATAKSDCRVFSAPLRAFAIPLKPAGQQEFSYFHRRTQVCSF